MEKRDKEEMSRKKGSNKKSIFHGQKVAVIDVLVVDVNTLSHDVSLYFLVFLRLRLSDWLSVRS